MPLACCGKFARFGRSSGQHKRDVGKKVGTRSAIALQGNVLRCFRSFVRGMVIGSDRLRFGLAAAEPSRDIRALTTT